MLSGTTRKRHVLPERQPSECLGPPVASPCPYFLFINLPNFH